MKGIAISAKAGAGKTTLANIIASELPNFKVYALASPIKQLDAELFLPVEGKPRWRYQQLGQALRDIDSMVWIRALDRTIDANFPTRACIDDLRQPNEYTHYRAKGYVTIRINAPYDVRIRRLYERDGTVDIEALAHPTETALDDYDFDYHIVNAGSMELLREQVQDVLEHMQGRE